MNFGDILDDWNKQTAKPYGKKRVQADARKQMTETSEAVIDGKKSQKAINPMDFWLNRYGVSDKDSELATQPQQTSRASERQRLLKKAPESTVDLHGLTRDEAWTRLDAFIRDAHRQGLEKVLVIHGKGNHSAEEPVLKRMVQLYFEQSDITGESSFSTKKDMSGGAAWVILRHKGTDIL